jgi:hypothetical protein
MGVFKMIDLGLRRESYGWPKSPAQMILAAEAYEHEVVRYERQWQEVAEIRRRVLQREVAGLHGAWQNLMGHKQYHLNHGRQLQADLLNASIQHAYEAWQDKQAELAAWTPVWEGA